MLSAEGIAIPRGVANKGSLALVVFGLFHRNSQPLGIWCQQLFSHSKGLRQILQWFAENGSLKVTLELLVFTAAGSLLPGQVRLDVLRAFTFGEDDPDGQDGQVIFPPERALLLMLSHGVGADAIVEKMAQFVALVDEAVHRAIHTSTRPGRPVASSLPRRRMVSRTIPATRPPPAAPRHPRHRMVPVIRRSPRRRKLTEKMAAFQRQRGRDRRRGSARARP